MAEDQTEGTDSVSEPGTEEDTSTTRGAAATPKRSGKAATATEAKSTTKNSRSGNPAKAAAAKTGRPKRVDPFRDPDAGPTIGPRFVLSLALMALGIAWIVYYYVGIRPPMGDYGALDAQGKVIQPGGPTFLSDLMRWNYVIGFGLFFIGLIISAHRSTPLGRGRGVVVGMLGCFLLGLAWICVYYAIANDTSKVPVFNDLDQKNLFVGIVFMAVGFTFATRWE